MKIYNLSFALLMGIAALSSCNDKLDTNNPNTQSTETFGSSNTELEECVIAAYNHIRMEGTYARVGYNIDVMRGDEAWNCSQVWYLPFDDLNEPTTDGIGQWSWRDWYYTINVCNYITKALENQEAKKEYVRGNDTTKDRILGQALFLRGLAYYNLVNYYQNPPLITDYDTYNTIESQYVSNVPPSGQYQYDIVLDQVEADFTEAVNLLPKKSVGGEWSTGRATSGAAAGFLARALMQRHKYDQALIYLEGIINHNYGSYKLMPNFGDNFREGTAYENNAESLFEVQFLDKDSQGSDDEWTPVNTSKDATQGSAIESNFAPGDFGGWADIAATPWIYNLFISEKDNDDMYYDTRLYWTLGTYESDWQGNPYSTLGNVCYTKDMASDGIIVNNTNGGIPFAKWTHLRTGEYSTVVTGLHDGINLRLMRFSDVLLRAAECENEINGASQKAIGWINQVRDRAHLHQLDYTKFQQNDQAYADTLFEIIANIERPKEFAGEYGRGNDLIRWGFFYNPDRLEQIKGHNTVHLTKTKSYLKENVTYADHSKNGYKSSYDTYVDGHEFLPIYKGTLDDDKNLVGNSANNSTSNKTYHTWRIHPVIKNLNIKNFYK